MKKLLGVMVVGAAVLAATASVQAADNKVMMPIDQAMNSNDAKAKLGDSVQFFFGNQSTPKVITRISSDQTSQKTNSFGKSPEQACSWAFLSAMMQMQKRAQSLGANAIINIQSNYGNMPVSSTTEYECHDGRMMTGVAFKGDFVKIK